MVCCTVILGFSDENGSWKMNCMFSLSWRSFFPLATVTSSPSKMIEPPVLSSRWIMVRPSVDLPQPDSPTTPERLALVDRERHVIDRVQHAPRGLEVLLQVPSLYQRRHTAPLLGDLDAPAVMSRRDLDKRDPLALHSSLTSGNVD